MAPRKKYINKDTVGSLDRYDLEGHIEGIIERLTEFRNANPGGTMRLDLRLGWDECIELAVDYLHEETDEEFKARRLEENRVARQFQKEARLQREELDKIEYERLKKKFEK